MLDESQYLRIRAEGTEKNISVSENSRDPDRDERKISDDTILFMPLCGGFKYKIEPDWIKTNQYPWAISELDTTIIYIPHGDTVRYFYIYTKPLSNIDCYSRFNRKGYYVGE